MTTGVPRVASSAAEAAADGPRPLRVVLTG
ncbi:MAG: hypothetical protein QOG20_5841, partial [Pseudonocardiales bacterium]|nr:hypothetical protein [Pseudonocardiales bacterium]